MNFQVEGKWQHTIIMFKANKGYIGFLIFLLFLPSLSTGSFSCFLLLIPLSNDLILRLRRCWRIS